MNWPYHFVDLTDPEKLYRRHLLDRYGSFAQLSALVPVLVFQLYRLAVWVSSKRTAAKEEYLAVPGSPSLKNARISTSGNVSTRQRQIKWWLETELLNGWGTRGHWLAGLGWASWLVFLSMHKTGEDYMHVTKRFGMIAASQLPVQYMLSMKSPFSPFALAFHASHEELNPYHRILGRVIFALLVFHASLYLNYFTQLSVLLKRIGDLDVILGLAAFSLIFTLLSTASQVVRNRSYRVFFICHLLIGVTLLPILFFHVTHLRIYVVESLALFVLDVIARKLDTVTAFTKISKIPNTSLTKLSIPIPAKKMDRFRLATGQHVYLSLPTASASSPIHQLLCNPFTVAATTETDITLILRLLNGPTSSAFRQLAKLSKANPPINIEGPYGSSMHFPNLTTAFDRILLIAGGIGATFALPIYRDLQESLESEGTRVREVEMVWSVKAKDETIWTDIISASEADSNLQIYITGATATSPTTVAAMDGGLELTEMVGNRNGRPDLKKAVDVTFRHGTEESVAILVCGPNGMGREVRKHVSHWVNQGRQVWFHNESFGI